MKKYILSSIILLLAAANTAWGQSYVAEISGGDQYATLEGAFNAAITANANKTITLLADCEVTSTITVDNGKSLTLDLAGHTVSSAISTTFKVSNGTLIVNDNGATKGGIMVTGEAFRVDSRNSGVTSATGAMLTINSGVNVTSSGDACIFIREYATVNTSGNLTSNGQYATIQGNGSDQATTCNVTISGGSVTATQSSGVYFPQNGTLTVSGGIVTGNESGIAIKSGTLNVTGGTIHCTGPDTTPTSGWSNGVNASGCAIQIESNNGYGNVSVSISGTPTITSDNGIAVYEYIGGGNNTQLQSLTISGGTFTSGTGKQPLMLSQEAATANAAAVSGGTFSSVVPTDFCAPGYVPVTTPDANGMYTVQVDAASAVASITNANNETTNYLTLQAAIDAATAGQTIELLTNIDLGSSYVVINGDKAVTIDGGTNQYEIMGTGSSSGTDTESTIVLQGSGAVTLKNLKITNSSSNNNGVGIRGTAYSGKLTIDNCEITVPMRGVNVMTIDYGFSMDITGSTIQSNIDARTTTYVNDVNSRGISFSDNDELATAVTITNTTIQGFRYDIYVDETKQNLTLTMNGVDAYGLNMLNLNGANNTVNLNASQNGATTFSACTNGGLVTNENAYAASTNIIYLDEATKTATTNNVLSALSAQTTLTTVSAGTGKYKLVSASAGEYVAQIDNNKYATLAAAIAAAQDGETITLLKDCSGGGLFIGPNKFTTNGLTIDFGGFTYTVTTPVGSTNTVNQALHFEQGNKITLTNGGIKMTTDATELAAFQMFMQNYGTLTIDKMNLDGTGIAVATYSGYSAPWEGTTKPQFNYNTAGNSVIRNSTITMTGDLGIDHSAALTIEDDAVINVNAIVTKGTDNRYASATPTITVENGAQFKLTDATNAAAFETLLNANGQSLGTAVNGVYTVETVTYVASITVGQTTTNYTSLESALTAAYSDGTITLLKDVEFAGGWTNAGVNPNHENNGYSSWKLTIDGDGYKITPATGASTDFVFSFNLYNTVDFKDVVFDGWTSNNVLVFTGGTVSLDGVTITNTVNSASGSSHGLIRTDNADFTATNCSFTNNTCAMVIGVNIVTGGGDVTITNNLFSGNTCDAPGVVYFNKNTSGTKSLTNNTFTGNTVSTSGNGSVVYCSGTVNAMTGNLFSSNNVSVTADKKEGVIVCGSGAGNSVINSNAFDSNTLGTTATHYATIYTSANIDVSNNYWGGAAASESDIYNPDSKTITNTNYATAYAANTESNGATVTLAPVYVAQVGDEQFTSLAAAINAVADGGTITLLADVATPRYNLETKSFTVNLNGKTLSSTDTTDDGIIFCPKNGKTITIDGTTASSKVVGTIMLTSNQVGHIVINGGTYENNLYTPIYVNGNASNTSTVSITDATVIGNRIDTDSDVETGFGMYLAGPATVTVTNTNVTAVRTGIEVRAGSLTVDGGSITSTATSFNENANGNGGTIIGAAVAISQHNTNKAITVNLNSGTYSGCYAVYEHDVQSTTAGEQVAINITGGDYTGTSGTAIMIKDVDTPTATVPVTAAISGGTFNSAVPNNYCATNYVPAGPFANGKYSVELNNATSINEATITVSVESATYIGSAITPIVTVKDGDTPLVKDTDYTILFDGTYTNAKTYNNAIIITGIGNYRDTRKSNFVISPRNINDVTVSGNSKIYRETGYSVDDIKGSIGLTYTYNTTSNPLTVGETNDYTITVDDTKTYKTPGTYAGVITLTAVEGEGKNYTGSRTVDFMIGNATDIANCDITVPTIIYNGKEQLPAANVTVKNGSTTLTNNADYEISFANGSNFTNAGTTQITITGKGDSYYGSKTVNYTIERRDIATCSINNSTLFGDGSVKDPAAIVTITYNNGTETLNLVKATENALNDYTITVSAGYVYQEPRTYTGALTITGNGNYKGTVTKDFVINNNDNPALNLATALVTSTAIYNGAQQVPSANNVVVKIANQVVDPTNYVVTYTGEAADYKDAKTYAHAVVITATGSAYYGKLTADYVIAKRDMLNVVAAETAEMKWTGNTITPNINTDDNKNISLTLTTGPDGNQVVYPLVAADYTYTTQPAVIQEPGLYTFTFEGRGNFTGTKTLQNVRVLKNMDTQGGNIKLDLADSRIILPATIPPATESAKITAADITVKDGATVLTQGVDYSATIYSKVTEDDQHNFTFNDADIVAEIQNDPNGKDDGIYWLKITGLNNSYEQSKTLKFYVLKEYYAWNSESISSNYSIHLTDAQNASVGALVVNNTTDPVTVENCNAVATNLATLIIEPTMNITLKDGQGSGSKSETITVKITDIEPNAFDGCSSLSSLDASKLVGFTPNSLNRNSKGTTFYGIAKQALIYLNGTTFKGENYVYTPDPNPSDNSQYFCELFKIYDDFSGSQTGFTGNDYCWDLISQHGFTAYTIENMRQFAEGRHYTVCLPYSIPIPKNVKAYTLDATSDKLFGFKEVGTGTLKAYTPYVLIPTTSGQLLSTINAEVPSISRGTQFNPTQAGNYTLYGTMSYMDGTDAAGKYIMQYNNGNPTWKKITSNSSYSNGACILPMRAYIMSNTSGSREFFDVVFTNIDGTTLTFDKVTFDDDTIYDLSGRKVELLERGHTYIINGKKVIVK